MTVINFKEEIEKIIQNKYITIEQHERDMKNLKEELLREIRGEIKITLPIVLPNDKLDIQEYRVLNGLFDPGIHNEPRVVYIDSKHMMYIDGEPIGIVPGTTDFSDTFKQSIEDAHQVEENVKAKNESLEEFSPDDLNAYSMKAFGTPAGWAHMQPKTTNNLGNPDTRYNPSPEENQSKWDSIANSLMKSWDNIGGNSND